MAAPSSAYDNSIMGKDSQPDHMDRYYSGPADNRGVHINSGIPNKVFYLEPVPKIKLGLVKPFNKLRTNGLGLLMMNLPPFVVSLSKDQIRNFGITSSNSKPMSTVRTLPS
jgi:hypothetical protein